MVLAEEQYLPQLLVLRWPLKRLTQDVSRGMMPSQYIVIVTKLVEFEFIKLCSLL